MKRLIPLLILSFLLPQIVFGAIAFDNATDGGGYISTASYVFSHTVNSNTNGLLLISAWSYHNPSYITGITAYNATAGTSTAVKTCSVVETSQAATQEFWYVLGPGTGTSTITITGSKAAGIIAEASSYTGIKNQAYEASSTKYAASATVTTTVTTVSDNSWMFSAIRRVGGTSAAGTSSVQRLTTAAGMGMYDSGGAISPAATTTYTIAGTGTNSAICSLSFAPYVAPAATRRRPPIVITPN